MLFATNNMHIMFLWSLFSLSTSMSSLNLLMVKGTMAAEAVAVAQEELVGVVLTVMHQHPTSRTQGSFQLLGPSEPVEGALFLSVLGCGLFSWGEGIDGNNVDIFMLGMCRFGICISEGVPVHVFMLFLQLLFCDLLRICSPVTG